MNPIFQHVDVKNIRRQNLRKATFRERAIAQFIDGIILGAICSLFFWGISRGQVFSVWVSPIVPQYVLEIDETYKNNSAAFWWGGYFFDVELRYGKELHIGYPAPLLWMLYLLYYTFFTSVWGQTPGKLLKRLVVLDEHRRLLTPRQALLRWLGSVAGLLPLGWGIWRAAFKSDWQTWHDRWTGTTVYFYDF